MENVQYWPLLTGSISFLSSRSPFCPSSYGFISLNQSVHTPSDSASAADSAGALAAPPGAAGLHNIFEQIKLVIAKVYGEPHQ